MNKDNEKYNIIELLTRTNVVKDECIKICGENGYTEDLMQEITMVLLEYDADKIITMNNQGKLLNFIRRVIRLQYKSENSPFYAKYKRFGRYQSEVDLENSRINKEEAYDDKLF